MMVEAENKALLASLMQMRVEPEGAALTFVHRLARENDWTVPYAERVIDEYRRFLFLAATSGHAVTPSDEVDQAWHLHLAYSRHYWEILCGEILKRPLHHGPTLGGASEGSRYREQYQRTLEAYQLAFGGEPPADIWPDTDRRFHTEYRRVPVGQHWMVPKKAGYAVIPFLTLAACTPEEWEGAGLFAGLLLVVFVVAVVIILPRKKNRRGGGCDGGFFDSDSGDSGCGGGCGGGG
jgi:hypothetical protein